MTEKQFTEKEISNAIEEVIKDYVILFQNDKMNYTEFALIENVVIKLQGKFRELVE